MFLLKSRTSRSMTRCALAICSLLLRFIQGGWLLLADRRRLLELLILHLLLLLLHLLLLLLLHLLFLLLLLLRFRYNQQF